MSKEPSIELFNFVLSLSDAIDLVSPVIANHHKEVAYISLSIASELKLPLKTQRNLVIAGALHDIGVFSLKEKLDTLNFDIEEPHTHAERSYYFLKSFSPFSEIAHFVRFHHVPWENGKGVSFNKNPVPFESHILHLADRIAISIDKKSEILGQVKNIKEKIGKYKGKRFVPEIVEAFNSLSEKEYFWLDLTSSTLEEIIFAQVSEEWS